jgi:uncharacterized membrane protein (Fun14 family)
MNPLHRVLALLLGAGAASGDGPWRARTVHLALLLVIVGLGFWARDAAKGPPPLATQQAFTSADQPAPGSGWDFTRPVPGYVRFSASYIGGFVVGWALRHFLRLALGLVALAALLVGLGKCAGCNSAPAETRVRDSAAWVRHEADAATDYVKGLLPSTAAGAVGVFLGFRRKGKAVAPNTDQQTGR